MQVEQVIRYMAFLVKCRCVYPSTLTFATVAVRPPQKVNWKIPASVAEQNSYGLTLSRSHLLRPPYGGFRIFVDRQAETKNTVCKRFLTKPSVAKSIFQMVLNHEEAGTPPARFASDTPLSDSQSDQSHSVNRKYNHRKK